MVSHKDQSGMMNRLRVLLSGVALFALVMIGLSDGTAAQTDAPSIVVNVEADLAPVSPLLFGHRYGLWMWNMDVSEASPNDASPLDDYRAAKVGLLRFAAGDDGIRREDLDYLAELADALNVEAVVQLPVGTGGVEDAVAWVRYCNIENAYAIRYWELVPVSGLDPTSYNEQFRTFAMAMKAIDPELQIIGPGVAEAWRSVLPAFIAANGDIVDVISWQANAIVGDDEAAAANAEDVLATPKQVVEPVGAIRAWWQDADKNPRGYMRPAPKLLSAYGVAPSEIETSQFGGQVSALWNAELLGRLASLGVDMGAYIARPGALWPSLKEISEAPCPVFDVYRLYARWGTTQVDAAFSEPTLPAFASLREDGRLAILVINKDPDQEQQASLSIEGLKLSGQAQVWLQDETHEAEELPSLNVAETFTHTFPPYSVTLFILSPATWTSWALWVGIALFIVVLSVPMLMIRVQVGRDQSEDQVEPTEGVRNPKREA